MALSWRSQIWKNAICVDPEPGPSKSQSQARLLLATGQASIETDPDPLFKVYNPSFDLTATKRVIWSGFSLEHGLAGMFSTAQHSKVDQKNSNAALIKSGARTAVETGGF